ncbi:MAG: RdgB/HAM1 family non-canonical purine NTP pyrophosphatase [Promethearchaeota archaeon]
MPIKKILFATSNQYKVEEARQILKKYQIFLDHYCVNLPELQNDSLEKIAKFSVTQIDPVIKGPIFVEDTGLFIEALNGFPGPFSAFVFRTIGNDGILKLLSETTNRSSYFKSIIVLRSSPSHSTDFKYSIFEGVTEGKIVLKKRGKKWGFDPIFEPIEGEGLTYAEMANKKVKISHRTKALQKLGEVLSRI